MTGDFNSSFWQSFFSPELLYFNNFLVHLIQLEENVEEWKKEEILHVRQDHGSMEP